MCKIITKMVFHSMILHIETEFISMSSSAHIVRSSLIWSKNIEFLVKNAPFWFLESSFVSFFAFFDPCNICEVAHNGATKTCLVFSSDTIVWLQFFLRFNELWLGKWKSNKMVAQTCLTGLFRMNNFLFWFFHHNWTKFFDYFRHFE